MAHPPEARMAVRTAYIGGLPIEQAADKAGVPLGTARRWKAAAAEEGDDWDKFQRASLIVAGGGFDAAMGRVAAATILRCEAVLDKLSSSGTEVDPMEATRAIALLADSLTKAQSAARKLMPESGKLSVAMDVLKRLDAFIREADPALAPVFAELLPRFGRELAAAYG